MKTRIGRHWPVIGLLALATCLGALSLIVTWRTAENERAVVAYTPSNLLRLHIIPDSDHPADQDLKLRVRDAVLRRLGPEFSSMKTTDEAMEFIRQNQDVVLDTVRAEIERWSSRPVDCSLELGIFEFPDRAYGSAFVPSGRYRALRIVLGSGRGANWWCVLFPPLCFKDLATASHSGAAVPTAATGQVALVDEGSLTPVDVQYRLKVVDWLEAKRAQVLRALARPRPAGTGD